MAISSRNTPEQGRNEEERSRASTKPFHTVMYVVAMFLVLYGYVGV